MNKLSKALFECLFLFELGFEAKFLDLFGHKPQPKVRLNYDVITKCQGVNCPVQASSECTKPKIAARKDMMDNVNSGNLQNIMGTGMLKNTEMMKNTSGEGAPKPEDLPGPYCPTARQAAKTWIIARCAFAADAKFSRLSTLES